MCVLTFEKAAFLDSPLLKCPMNTRRFRSHIILLKLTAGQFENH